MAMRMPEKLKIVGCGPGSPEYLTETGRRAIDSAVILVGSPHLLALYGKPEQEQIPFGSDIEGVIEAISSKRKNGKIVILVSGDPGLCSLAKPVIRRFGKDACEIIPGISSVQLAFSRLGLDWINARIISAHKSIPDISPAELTSSGNIAILAGHRHAQAWISDLAGKSGNSRVLVVCEDLSLENEKISRVTAGEFRKMRISSRTIVLLLEEDTLQ